MNFKISTSVSVPPVAEIKVGVKPISPVPLLLESNLVFHLHKLKLT